MTTTGPENDPATVRREYASEERFLARRLSTSAELRGPLVEDATVDAAGDTEPGRVLDVGCGTGDFTARLARALDLPVVALDQSARMAELARGCGLATTIGDVQALPFADGACTCVVANRVLYHLPDLDRGLAEIVRVLRPGGRLVAVTYSTDHLRELWDVLGPSPIAREPFSAETGAAALEARFASVERRDVVGMARFRTRSAARGYLDAYGEFSTSDFVAQVGKLSEPFDATYRHALFVARTPG
jgi:SAM-dependent methyltransferase